MTNLSRRFVENPKLREDVFTPASAPTLTFVERPSVGDSLVEHLKVHGRPLCIEGPYRSGKTTLALTKVRQLFPNQIHIVCNRKTTFESILIAAFDALGATYNAEKSDVASRQGAGLSASFFEMVKGEIGGTKTESTSKESRVVAPQLSSRSLAQYAAKAEAPLILDDVHKLLPDELEKVAEAMREWQTLAAVEKFPKFVVIGTTAGDGALARQMLKTVPDLRQRLGVVRMQLMSDTEIKEIIRLGGDALNVDFTDIMADIVTYSYGYPGVCQDLCSHACAAARIDFEQEALVTLSSRDLEKGLEIYLDSCELGIKFAFERCEQVRSPELPGGFVSIVLDKVGSAGIDGTSKESIFNALRTTFNLDDEEISKGLAKLADEDDGVLFWDRQKQTIRFIEPNYFIHYQHSKASKSGEISKMSLVRAFTRAMTSRGGSDKSNPHV